MPEALLEKASEDANSNLFQIFWQMLMFGLYQKMVFDRSRVENLIALFVVATLL